MNKPESQAIFETIQSSFIHKWFSWIIDSKYRKIVTITPWLKEQLGTMEIKAEAKKIKSYSDPETQIMAIFEYVYQNYLYVNDPKQYGMADKWETIKETIANKKADCESGCLVMYALAREKGVPANRMYIVGGQVVGGGHAWLAFKPTEYPLNYVFLDWCYTPTLKRLYERNLFNIENVTVCEYKQVSNNAGTGFVKITSKYLKLWFMFNEDKTFTSLKPRFMK